MQDNAFGDNFRGLTVARPDQQELALVFISADPPAKKERVRSQAGEYVFLILETEDLEKDHQIMKDKGVNFLGQGSRGTFTGTGSTCYNPQECRNGHSSSNCWACSAVMVLPS